MTVFRLFVALSVVLFGAIGVTTLIKRSKAKKTASQSLESANVIEIDLSNLQAAASPARPRLASVEAAPKQAQAKAVKEAQPVQEDIPDADRMALLFQKDSPLPIVKTLQYKSRVPWKSGRSAWLVDYASHYKTHLHFIARSMNGKPDYQPRPAAEGQYFNVLAPDVNFYFYLVIDISRCKLRLYTVLPDSNERLLLKSYRVGLGRVDASKTSGSVTPIGKYSLGTRIAVYQPKMMGNYRGKRTEMITVFGTRWIPFEKELENCSEPARGFGLHGTPWHVNSEGRLVDSIQGIGAYESDGCIRLRAPDIEELFAVIATHKTIVELVRDFSMAKLPGKEKMY